MTPLGYSALIHRYELPLHPLTQTFHLSQKTGVARHIVDATGMERIEIPRNRYLGDLGTVSQLAFALKRERLNLTVLAELFEREEIVSAVQSWLIASPTSGYARRAAFLAKWLVDAKFDYVLPQGTPRVPILDAAKYITGPVKIDAQFGVMNNLIGTPAFCPVVRRSDKLNSLLQRNLKDMVAEAISRIDPEVLVRAVDYLYLSETRSTFSIEKEIPDNQRAARFRKLLESAGTGGPLTEQQLCGWQNQIMSSYAAEVSFRHKQNWLSRPGRLRNVADYIPPAPLQVTGMMAGVASIAQLAENGQIDPMIAAALASFGLVFVHPFIDGNGRLHRFLIHHILRQSGFTPAGVVLPVSARMLNDLQIYAKLLSAYSQPRTALLNYMLDDESQTIRVLSSQPSWLYASFDATSICEFVLTCIAQCVEEDLSREVAYLEAYDRAKLRLDTWLDLPQPQLNNLIALIVQGNGKLSQRKRKRFEYLPDETLLVAEQIVDDEFAGYLGKLKGASAKPGRRLPEESETEFAIKRRLKESDEDSKR